MEEIIKKLRQIDEWLYLGSRDNAHILITKLIKELDDPNRIKDPSKKNNQKQDR